MTNTQPTPIAEVTPDRTSIIKHLEHLAAQNRREPHPNIPAAIALEAAASDVRAEIDEVSQSSTHK